MGHRRDWLEHPTLEFPHTGFWLVHVIGAIFVFMAGMRFAVRRATLPFIAYRFFKMLMHGR